MPFGISSSFASSDRRGGALAQEADDLARAPRRRARAAAPSPRRRACRPPRSRAQANGPQFPTIRPFPPIVKSGALVDSRGGCDRGDRPARQRRGVAPPRSRRRGAGRRGRGGGRRPRSRRVPPLLREAVPGPSARARPRRSHERGDRDRLRLAPRLTRAARGRSLACSRRRPPTEDELECGPEPTRIEHNCSGKHAGMLAVCRAKGWPSEGYRLESHPLQRACLAEIATAAGLVPRTRPCRRRRLRRADVGDVAAADGARLLAVRGARGRRDGRGRDASAPGADPRPAGRRHGADARARRAGRRRAGRRGSSAPQARTASASRSRSRTEPRAPRARRPRSCCDGSAWRRASWPLSRWRTPAARSSERSSRSGSEVEKIRLHKSQIPL